MNIPHRIRVQKDVVLKINRSLKSHGTISVMVGQEVTPADVLGNCLISSGFRVIKLAQILGVEGREVGKYLKKSLGSRIYEGELLAEKKGGFLNKRKLITSPTDGILEFLNPQTGEIRISYIPKKADLMSGVYGIVEAVDLKKGQVTIKTQATIIHGMFGSGRVRDGILHVISRWNELVSKSVISTNLEGKILAGGSLIFKEAISEAISTGLAGIITGGMNAEDYKGMASGRVSFPKKLDTDVGVSIVACEGFGAIPIGDDIYQTLLKYSGRFISIDGNKGQVFLPSFDEDCILKIRKTVLPKSLEHNFPSLDQYPVELKKGLRVRVVGNTYRGEQGKIVSFDKTETLMPSKIKTILATIENKSHKFQVPVANLESLDYSL